MLKNVHDVATIRYGATTVQAGSGSLTNVHDLTVVMRQDRRIGLSVIL